MCHATDRKVCNSKGTSVLAGLVSTTTRQLDREYKAEHILEVGNMTME